MSARFALGTLCLVAVCAACPGVELVQRFEPVEVPAPPGSSAPVLSAGDDGRLRLAWIEPRDEGGHALRFSMLSGDTWRPARTIAEGTDWFVNWADVPAFAAYPDGTLIATWLEKLGEGTYAYGVRWALSHDGGDVWEPQDFLHEDRSAGEHGFVSLAAIGGWTMRAVWLDGRGTVGDQGGHGGHGAMRLYSRTITSDGGLGREFELDDRVCDCCPTAHLALAEGTSLAFYRDRAEDERRDLSLAEVGPEGLREVREVSRDGWVVDGCPVNGPVLALDGLLVAAAWFTRGDDDTSRVRVAFSHDMGASFDPPLELARSGVVGSLSATFDSSGVLRVAWLARESDHPEARGWWALGGAHPERGVVGEPFELVEALPARASGVARLANHGGELWFAWTEVTQDGATRVRCARVAPPGT